MNRTKLDVLAAAVVLTGIWTLTLPQSAHGAAFATAVTLVVQESDGRPWARDPVMETILEATSAEDVLLSRVWDISVDSEGRVYVTDDYAGGVVVLSPDLTYVRTLGRSGDGPGEFRHVSTVQILPGDSVFVFDRNLSRITAFGPGSSEPAYAQRLPGGPYRTVFQTPKGFVAIHSPSYEASGADVGTKAEWLLRLRQDGSVADSLFAYPRKDNLVYRRGDPRGGGAVSISNHPFGHRPFVQMLHGDTVRAAYTSSLALEVTVIDIETGRQKAFSHPTPTVGVTRDELASAADSKSTRFARMLRDGAPYAWPPITGVVAGDAGLVLLGIRRTDRKIWEWALFREDGTHIASVALPSGVVVYALHEGRIIGSIVDEFDTPRIVAYRMGTDTLQAGLKP